MRMELYVLAAMVAMATCLTDDEIAIFRNRNNNTVETSADGSKLMISSIGIPDHEYGPFPGPHNPNEAQPYNDQEKTTNVPSSPVRADEEGCLPMGRIGLAVNGIFLYNPFNHLGENAVEGDTAEVFDDCDGHPDEQNNYHYHQSPGCLVGDKHDELVGVALDGHPIYGPYDAALGRDLKSKDLDKCHGRVMDGRYRYHITSDYPYIMGCFYGVAESGPAPGSQVDSGDDRRPPPGGMEAGTRDDPPSECSFAIADDYLGKDDEDNGGQGHLPAILLLVLAATTGIIANLC